MSRPFGAVRLLRMSSRPALHFLLAIAFSCAARASLKVDISPDNGRKDVLTPACENWTIKDGPTASKTFGEITVTLRQAGAVGDGLTTAWWKAGLDTDATISSDGVTIKDGDNGAELEMTVAGLSAGRHSIVTYHSWTSDAPMSPFDVYVDGEVKLKGIQPSC